MSDLSALRKGLNPYWPKWQEKNYWSLKAAAALSLNLDPDRVCMDPEKYRLICGNEITTYQMRLDALAGSGYEVAEDVDKEELVDWFFEHYPDDLPPEFNTFKSQIRRIVNSRSVKAVKRNEVVHLYLSRHNMGTIENGVCKVTGTGEAFLRQLKKEVNTSLGGLFTGSDDTCLRDLYHMPRLQTARNAIIKWAEQRQAHGEPSEPIKFIGR